MAGVYLLQPLHLLSFTSSYPLVCVFANVLMSCVVSMVSNVSLIAQMPGLACCYTPTCSNATHAHVQHL